MAFAPVENCSIDAVREAAARIAAHARVTPVLQSASIDRIAGASLHFKAEHLQRAGAFKFRGACNAVFSLDAAAAARGVVTQSSGNHGAAIALACRLRGIPATVVVPRGAPQVKLAAIADFGARIVPCEVSQHDRDRVTAQVLSETGGELIHPFDDPRVIAGQGTATLELMHQVPGLDAIIAPVSGGGLLSGTLIAAKALNPGIAVFGAEPEGAADACASLRQGRRIVDMRPDTICDGLRAHLSERTFTILSRHCDGILLASDEEVRQAMRLVFERMKQVVEPSGAVALAALLRARARFAGRRVGIVLSGGNLDLTALFGTAE
ncbi:MAG TPA: pyridoxal-phosphate dependent enzyme [Chiayiivirga sp.]|jgi:threonine dehydratase|uniref:Pyridoxal-phosphate dependent enzyme n=1 Tax=Denitratimonas tolerans TaxID=1338420 RepID=A0AAW9R5M5_9GAMM|nr:pyridoxal-phosphate dependent enzyme [Chiayiivirga sp.]MEB2314577.1 pyridoxal-phosphate dependent enzyme [Xanthomonadaceae bacterium]HMN35295.1 pyridoxal-phosphate dependent enzyme [Chiayiivirga sp.]HRN59424.1 pyridoxal-phosphate dependent enzyme [Chiayiivirga sp.]HRQ34232.1 pyridoxal-phosphate dependent enzyme [Chiayiivirga sp.]